MLFNIMVGNLKIKVFHLKCISKLCILQKMKVPEVPTEAKLLRVLIHVFCKYSGRGDKVQVLVRQNNFGQNNEVLWNYRARLFDLH